MTRELNISPTKEMITCGATLISRLDSSNSDVKVAFWLLSSDDTEVKTWKFFLASPLVKEFGPREFYKRIIEANHSGEAEEEVIPTTLIKACNMDEPIIKLLKIAISTNNNINGIRFSQNTINNVYIEDCYIYRLSSD